MKQEKLQIKGLSIIYNIIVALVAVSVIGVPFLHKLIDLKLACCWFIIACILSIVFSIIEVFSSNQKENKKEIIKQLISKAIQLVLFFIIFVGIFVCNYLDTRFNYYWFTFVLMVVTFPMLYLFLYFEPNEIKILNKEVDKSDFMYIFKANIFQMVILAFCFIAIVHNWVSWIFAFVGFYILYVFINIAKVFINIKDIPIINKYCLIVNFILACFGLVYLIFIIDNDNLQNIVLTIVSALAGGFITLLGVVYTIKRQEESKKRELKEKYKPHITIVQNKIEYDNNDVCLENKIDNVVVFTSDKLGVENNLFVYFVVRNVGLYPIFINKIFTTASKSETDSTLYEYMPQCCDEACIEEKTTTILKIYTTSDAIANFQKNNKLNIDVADSNGVKYSYYLIVEDYKITKTSLKEMQNGSI